MDNSDLPKLCMRRPCNTVQFQRLKATSLRDHGNPTGVSRASAGGGVQVASRDQLDITWRLVQSLDQSLGRFDGGRAKNTVPCFQETDKILRWYEIAEIAVYLLWHDIYDYNLQSIIKLVIVQKYKYDLQEGCKQVIQYKHIRN